MLVLHLALVMIFTYPALITLTGPPIHMNHRYQVIHIAVAFSFVMMWRYSMKQHKQNIIMSYIV